MKGLDKSLIKLDLDANTSKSWNNMIHIPLPKNHTEKNACKALRCKHPPGVLNQGVPRVLMPAMSEEVVNKMKLSHTVHTMNVKKFVGLYVAQKEIRQSKLTESVRVIKEDLEKGIVPKIFKKPFYIATASNGKKVVIDGHHGWGALHILFHETPSVIKPDMKIHVIDFKASPEEVIKDAFLHGGAINHPFRDELVSYDRKKTRRRRRV